MRGFAAAIGCGGAVTSARRARAGGRGRSLEGECPGGSPPRKPESQRETDAGADMGLKPRCRSEPTEGTAQPRQPGARVSGDPGRRQPPAPCEAWVGSRPPEGRRGWKTPGEEAEGRGGGPRDPHSCARPRVEGLGRGACGAARVLGPGAAHPRSEPIGLWGGGAAESRGSRAPPRFSFPRLGFGVRPRALLGRGGRGFPALKVHLRAGKWGVRWSRQGHHNRRAPPAVSARGACVRPEFSVDKSRILRL